MITISSRFIRMNLFPASGVFPPQSLAVTSGKRRVQEVLERLRRDDETSEGFVQAAESVMKAIDLWAEWQSDNHID